MTMHRFALVVALATASTAGICQRVTNNYTAPSPTPTPVPADAIEFRIFGSVGDVPIAIKFTDSVNGLTSLTTVSLPYVVGIRSLEPAIFLDLEARATPPLALISTSSLQAQIFVNGRLFREAFAAGISPLNVLVTGTFRR